MLVAGQLALSLVLLVGAGLMARAFIQMRSVPLGFDPSRAVTMRVELQGQRFDVYDRQQKFDSEASKLKRLAFYHALQDSVRQIPGVEQAGVGLYVPMSGEPGPITFRIATAADTPEIPAVGAIALAGFLESLRVPLVTGRYFAPEEDDRPVAIVDTLLAERLWGRESPLGRRLLLTRTTGPATPVDVVGVVQHVQLDGLRSRAQPEIFVTYGSRQYSALNIVARGANPAALAMAVEAAVQRLGPGRPVHNIRVLEDYVADASADTRFALFVLGVFAMLAVILSSVGVYGVVAYATARRTREIAVRLALGADGRRIVALIVREGLAWTAGGVGVGMAGALALSRYLTTMLFNVAPHDPLTFAAVAVLLCGVAVVASTLPAIRAVRVDPMLALRSE